MSQAYVTIVGTMKDNDSNEEKKVTISGLAMVIALSPADPPPRPHPQPPLGIWGPPDMPPGFWGGGMGPGVKPQPRPEHPIYYPPGSLPHPEHPIFLPGMPGWPGDGGGGGEGGRQPKFEAVTAWTPEQGWVVVFVPAEGTLVPTPSETK